jgi:hypothetical protein
MKMDEPVGLFSRVILALAIVLLDWIIFFIPFGSLLIAYVILFNPPWVHDFLNRLNEKGKDPL